MNKIILLLMLFCCSCCFGQQKDTIFFKSGAYWPVYKVIGSYNGAIFYTLSKNLSEEQHVDTAKVAHFTQFVCKSAVEKEDSSFYANKTKYKSESDYNISWLKYNLRKYYQEERMSQYLYGLSIASGIVYGVAPAKNKAFMYVTIGSGIAGFIVHVDSYKWIKRASLETTMNKVALKFKF